MILLVDLARTFVLSVSASGVREALRRTLLRVADEGVKALLNMLFSRFWNEEAERAADKRASALIDALLRFMNKQGFERDWACDAAPQRQPPTAGEVHFDSTITSLDARARLVALALTKS